MTQDNARHGLENLVQSLSQSIDFTFGTAAAGVRLAEQFVGDHDDATRPVAGDAALAALVGNSHAIRAIRIIGSDGYARLSSVAESPAEALSYSGQDWFVFHRDHPGTGLRLGNPIRAVRDSSWLVTLSRRIDRPDGRFGGVILVSLRLEFFQAMFDALDLGQDGAVSLQTASGIFLVRRPFSEKSIGLDASGGELFRTHLPRSRSGTFMIRALADNQLRYVSYRLSEKFPLVVAVARSEREILAGWAAQTRQNGAITIAVVLAMALLGGLILVQMRRRERMELASLAEQRLAKAVFDQTSQGIVVTDRNNAIVAANPAFTAITGYEVEEVLGRDPKVLSSGRQGRTYYEAMWKELLARDSWHGELWNRRKSGDTFLEQATISRLRDSSGAVVNHVAIFTDITRQKEAEEEIHKLAFIDALTGLANRRLGMDRMQTLLAHSHRRRKLAAVMLFDLDHFKEINDTHGHNVGDEVLVEVARRVSTLFREDDVLARLGGDEFMIGLGELEGTDAAVRMAERVMEQMRQPVAAGGREFRISSSLGIAMYPADAEDLPTLLQYADQAMYAAKANGRSGFRYFSKTMHEQALIRTHREERLRRAVAEGAFTVFFQPQVDLDTGLVVAAEALIRAHDPDLGGPAEFVPLCEELGLMGPIGDLTLAAACRQARLWRQSAHPIQRIAVNISAQQFSDDALAGKIANALAAENLPASALEIEVTETAAMADPAHTIRVLHAIRALGVRVAIDDFGTGYSSLAYLRDFPINTVKIDRAFVTGIEGNAADLELVRAVVSLSDALGLDTLAEGIETEGQWQLLLAAGCHQGQGYLFGKPAPAAMMGDQAVGELLEQVG